MATATTVKKPRANKNDKKSQPKIYTFEWKGLNRDGKKTGGELKGTTVAEIKSQLKQQGVNPKVVRKKPHHYSHAILILRPWTSPW